MLAWLRKALRHPAGERPASQEAPASVADPSAAGSEDWEAIVAELLPVAVARPGDATVRYRLGTALYQLDRAHEALPHLAEAARLAPDAANHHYMLGNALKDLERAAEAVDCYRRAVDLEPRHARAISNMGVALDALGRLEEALACYRRAAAIDPTLLPALGNLAVLLRQLERHDELEEACRLIANARPGSAAQWHDLGHVYENIGRHDEAVGCHQHAIRMMPRHTAARMSLHTAQLSRGQCDEALAGFRSLLSDEPDNAAVACRLLLALLFAPVSNDELYAEHLAVSRRFAGPALPTAPLPARRPAGGKIRVGYVSADLVMHQIAYSVASLVRFHDRSRFDVYLYSDVKRPDDLTRWFQQHAQWRAIAGLDDGAVAQQIRQDGIDVLVLLAGRFEGNRMLFAAHRAAPVQVSMHDPATSALPKMDYLVADRGLVPARTTEKFSERVACLPTFFLHPPIPDSPAVSPLPAFATGRLTFGSFNNAAKINERVVDLWARVLHAVPGSRLLLKYHDVFTIPAVRARYIGMFGRRGITEDRLVLADVAPEARAKHLERYAAVDIALDTHPFTGSITTFEALWMGVPVVTLEGERMVARWSASMLRKVGLSRLVARDETGYVGIARDLAADLEALGRLRAGLRDRVIRSPLCAEQARTRQLERLFRAMLAVRGAGEASGVPPRRASGPART